MRAARSSGILFMVVERENLTMANTMTTKDTDESTTKPVDRPAATLLRSWGKRMSDGKARVIPIYVGGSWSVAVPRGNKRVLSVNIASAKKN
jgi:hypothetical protein